MTEGRKFSAGGWRVMRATQKVNYRWTGHDDDDGGGDDYDDDHDDDDYDDDVDDDYDDDNNDGFCDLVFNNFLLV